MSPELEIAAWLLQNGNKPNSDWNVVADNLYRDLGVVLPPHELPEKCSQAKRTYDSFYATSRNSNAPRAHVEQSNIVLDTDRYKFHQCIAKYKLNGQFVAEDVRKGVWRVYQLHQRKSRDEGDHPKFTVVEYTDAEFQASKDQLQQLTDNTTWGYFREDTGQRCTEKLTKSEFAKQPEGAHKLSVQFAATMAAAFPDDKELHEQLKQLCNCPQNFRTKQMKGNRVIVGESDRKWVQCDQRGEQLLMRALANPNSSFGDAEEAWQVLLKVNQIISVMDRTPNYDQVHPQLWHVLKELVEDCEQTITSSNSNKTAKSKLQYVKERFPQGTFSKRNAFNEFQHQHKGEGLTSKQAAEMYKQEKGRTAESRTQDDAAAGSQQRQPNAFNEFQHQHKGEGLTSIQAAQLYHEQQQHSTGASATTQQRRPNAFNEFQHQHKGEGLTTKLAAEMYKQEKGRTAESRPQDDAAAGSQQRARSGQQPNISTPSNYVVKGRTTVECGTPSYSGRGDSLPTTSNTTSSLSNSTSAPPNISGPSNYGAEGYNSRSNNHQPLTGAPSNSGMSGSKVPSNQWNAHQAACKGQGMTKAEIRNIYQPTSVSTSTSNIGGTSSSSSSSSSGGFGGSRGGSGATARNAGYSAPSSGGGGSGHSAPSSGGGGGGYSASSGGGGGGGLSWNAYQSSVGGTGMSKADMSAGYRAQK